MSSDDMVAQSNPDMIFLTCKHTALYSPPPRRGDTVFCRKCGDYVKVTGGQRMQREYRKVNCLECRYIRTFHNNFAEAFIKADVHHLKTGHTVIVKSSQKLLKTFIKS